MAKEKEPWWYTDKVKEDVRKELGEFFDFTDPKNYGKVDALGNEYQIISMLDRVSDLASDNNCMDRWGDNENKRIEKVFEGTPLDEFSKWSIQEHGFMISEVPDVETDGMPTADEMKGMLKHGIVPLLDNLVSLGSRSEIKTLREEGKKFNPNEEKSFRKYMEKRMWDLSIEGEGSGYIHVNIDDDDDRERIIHKLQETREKIPFSNTCAFSICGKTFTRRDGNKERIGFYITPLVTNGQTREEIDEIWKELGRDCVSF